MRFATLLRRDAGSGLVVAVDDASLTIATRQGTIIAARTDATAYHTGDRVRLVNGLPVGRLKPAGDFVRI